jgi:hypothetical protein
MGREGRGGGYLHHFLNRSQKFQILEPRLRHNLDPQEPHGENGEKWISPNVFGGMARQRRWTSLALTLFTYFIILLLKK